MKLRQIMNSFNRNIIFALALFFSLSVFIFTAQVEASSAGTLKLSSGVYVMDIERIVIQENQQQATIKYRLRLTDSGGESSYTGANIKFEAYSEQKNTGFIVQATEVQSGFYTAELTFQKDNNWSVSVLGVHEPYPFRASFYEVFLPDEGPKVTAAPVINEPVNANSPARTQEDKVNSDKEQSDNQKAFTAKRLLILVMTVVAVLVILGGVLIYRKRHTAGFNGL